MAFPKLYQCTGQEACGYYFLPQHQDHYSTITKDIIHWYWWPWLMLIIDLCMSNIGEYGSNSDSNVFQFSKFGQKFMNEKLNIPGNKRLPNYNDEGPMPPCYCRQMRHFPLLHNLMRPFTRYRGVNFTKNRKQSSIFVWVMLGCVVGKMHFGILAQRWRIFNRRILLSADNADNVIKAACCLYNYLTEDKKLRKISVWN